ncbi:MAG: DUF1592 domain-containing protein [Verrucomicrobiota bacterium]
MYRPLKAAVLMVSITGLFVKAEAAPTFGEMPEKHFAIFDRYCLDCHDSLTEKGSVNLEDLPFAMDTVESAERWQKVLNSLNSGEMPPENKKQLTDEEKTEFLADLSNQLVVARDALADSGGVITMRRLNRREYENTIEDLLGVRINAGDLPDDTGSGSFDTNGSSLFFSSDQFETYLRLAEHALDYAMEGGDRPKVRKQRVQTEDLMLARMQEAILKIGDAYFEKAYRGGEIPSDPSLEEMQKALEARKNYRWANHEAWLANPASRTGTPLYNLFMDFALPDLRLPYDGVKQTFRIRIRAALMEDDLPEHRTYLEYGSGSNGARRGELNVAGFKKVSGTMENPQILEFEYTPQDVSGLRFSVRERHINQLNAAKRFFRDAYFDEENGEVGPTPAIWVDWIEWEGPLLEEWPPAAYQKLFVSREENQTTEQYHRVVLTHFAKRAFRTKEPSVEFLDKLMVRYGEEVEEGVKPEEALKEQLAIVLTSPEFLYLNEPTFGEEHRELNDKELAVRLSYFLWSSPPDGELLALAEENRLKDRKTLRQQAMRLLRDPKARNFVQGFVHQWLHMERLDFFQFNYELFPRYDDSLKESARAEVFETILEGIREERSVGEFLKSDHVVINDILAGHYGIDRVEGESFRRVPVPDNLPRGGFMGMTAVMAMGADGEKTSPVERGAWVMRNLLNAPPPPAPPNVPQLSRFDGEMINARKRLLVHQEEAQCAQCHQRIDPLGFGLENFDAIGQWREKEMVQPPIRHFSDREKADDPNWREKIAKPHYFEIDSSGTLPDGTSFRDFYELRDRIFDRREDFARGFTEELIAYALGRPFGFADEKMASQILSRAEANDFVTTELILGVVQSKRFRMK